MTKERDERGGWSERLAVAGAGALHGAAGVFSFAPFGQFYLAWVAVAALLWATVAARTTRGAVASAYLAGLCYFGGNLWYLWYIGPFPMLGAWVYLAVYPAIFALVWRPIGRRANGPGSTLLAALAAAVVWVGVDWLRAYVLTGLPYVFLGHAQLPLLAMSQVADVLGAYGVTAWVALVGASLWAIARHGRAWERWAPTLAATAAALAGTFLYGQWRLGQSSFRDGPRVLLLQPSVPLLNTEPVDSSALVDWLVRETLDGLDEDVDLVVWPESSAPPLNVETRRLGFGGAYGALITRTHGFLRSLSRGEGPAVLVGGSFKDDWQALADGTARPGDRRNSVYLYRDGQQASERYDKRHLFPFGEYIPFGTQPPPIRWLHAFFMLFNPWGHDHSLTVGEADVVFEIPTSSGEVARAVTPICFEDIIPGRVRDLIYDDGTKVADVLVNVTNDGWFRGNQMAQHLQAASFRSIENRVPTARSVNTGVSAVVDADGRLVASVPASTAGSVAATIPLDGRSSPFGVVGDLFAHLCAAATGVAAAVLLAFRVRSWIRSWKS